jgi:hypothetical protein
MPKTLSPYVSPPRNGIGRKTTRGSPGGLQATTSAASPTNYNVKQREKGACSTSKVVHNPQRAKKANSTTPRTIKSKKKRKKLPKSFKYERVGRDHALYEEKIEFEKQESYKAWYNTQRLIDVSEWERIRLGLEVKMNREVQRRGAKMDEAIKLEKEKLAKKKLEKEAKLEQKKLVHEMKVFKAKQLEKAKRLFVGNVLQQNFVAWKEYTQKTIRKREERRRRRKKAIKWCLFCSIFCTLFILGSIYLVNLYVQEQERRQKLLEEDMALEQDMKDGREARNKNRLRGRRLQRVSVQEEEEVIFRSQQ